VGFTYLALASTLLRHRRAIVAAGVATALVTAVATLLKPRTWTAVSMFTTQSRRMPSGISGIAAQIGIAIPNLEASQSPQFFESLLKTRDIVDAVIQQPYGTGPDGSATVPSLLDYYKLEGATPERRLAEGEKKVLSKLRTVFNPKTSVVALSYTADLPEVASQVNAAFLHQLDLFNTMTRQSQATAERQFTERRLAEVAAELKGAEERLVSFLVANRVVRQGTEVGLQEQRLRRQLTLRQQVHAQLAQAYENARIEEVRDMPALTVVQQPKPPLLPDRRGLVSKTILGFLLGMMLASVALLVWLAMRGSAAEHPAELEELRALRTETWQDLRRPWRLLGVGVRRT
jgi:uncharacterized protein involved in exopolysaccharide biosynthesis